MEHQGIGQLEVTHEHADKGAAAERMAWLRAVGIGLGVALIISVMVTAFAWPAANTEPRNIPIGVVGPPEAMDQARSMTGDVFDPQPVADADAARQLIQDREVYGAILYQPDGPPQLMNASAASPAVARIIQGIAETISLQVDGERSVPVEDVAPLPEGDPFGAGFTAAVLPLVMGGLITGVAMSFVVTGIWRRVAGALVAAMISGPVVTLIVQTWLGSLSGSFWANAGVISLTISAISLTLIGLYALIDRAAIGVVAVTFFLLGNPLSGAASAPEMLPNGLGPLGQLLPAGASATLLRSTSFFEGAGSGGPLLVMFGWVAVGVILAIVGWRYRPSSQHALFG